MIFTRQRAFCTQSFHHIVYALHGKSRRQGHHGDMDAFQAKSAVTVLAIEMRVQIVYLAITLTAAHGILQ